MTGLTMNPPGTRMPQTLEIRALRITVPAREAIVRADPRNRVIGPDAEGEYIAHLRRPPPGLVVVRSTVSQHICVRTADDPEFPGEVPAAWHERGAWLPCPRRGCGLALAWYEAGYVPGYRICLRSHHAMISEDGSGASPA